MQLRGDERRATARRPRTARARRRSARAGAAAASSVVAIPPAMFAPAWLCTSGTPARSKIPAAIAAVVVLPLVAEISTLPRGRRAPSVADRVRRPGASAPCRERSWRRRRAAARARRRPAPARAWGPAAGHQSLVADSPAAAVAGRRAARESRRGQGRGCANAESAVSRAGTSIVTAPRSARTRTRQLADRIAVGVHRERPVGG